QLSRSVAGDHESGLLLCVRYLRPVPFAQDKETLCYAPPFHLRSAAANAKHNPYRERAQDAQISCLAQWAWPFLRRQQAWQRYCYTTLTAATANSAPFGSALTPTVERAGNGSGINSDMTELAMPKLDRSVRNKVSLTMLCSEPPAAWMTALKLLNAWRTCS